MMMSIVQVALKPSSRNGLVANPVPQAYSEHEKIYIYINLIVQMQRTGTKLIELVFQFKFNRNLESRFIM